MRDLNHGKIAGGKFSIGGWCSLPDRRLRGSAPVILDTHDAEADHADMDVRRQLVYRCASDRNIALAASRQSGRRQRRRIGRALVCSHGNFFPGIHVDGDLGGAAIGLDLAHLRRTAVADDKGDDARSNCDTARRRNICWTVPSRRRGERRAMMRLQQELGVHRADLLPNETFERLAARCEKIVGNVPSTVSVDSVFIPLKASRRA
jgi:hypothetical protein